MIDLPAGEIIALAAALVVSGCLMGFLAGFFGIGGGGVAVPVLYELFRVTGVPEDIRMQIAIGTSLAIMIPTTIRSARSHASLGSLDGDVVRRLAAPILVGVVLGSVVVRSASPQALRLIWVLFTTTMCLKLVFGKDSWRLGDGLPKSRLVEAYGIFVGVISTLLSIGGGAFITMLMTLYNRPIKVAIGTSAGIGPFIALPGMIGFVWAGWGASGLPPLSLGFVSLIGVALVMPASVLAAPFGAKAANGIPRRTLELLFAAFLATVGTRFLIALVS